MKPSWNHEPHCSGLPATATGSMGHAPSGSSYAARGLVQLDIVPMMDTVLW
jgi:hypothetical protein